ncbi:DUF4405 domain-containing protein [Nonomuraea mesophila]|uniref:DUF4405 domain-containing protein n=1 Tax=Nonomuraea mesophila TaxID=2530382 RepID=A0A4R5FJF3_9ACTN|nr:DUF4405 domain-containing protein [Nonomuraea mesophila]
MAGNSPKQAKPVLSWIYPALLVLVLADLFLIDVLPGGLSVHSLVGLVLVSAVALHLFDQRAWISRTVRRALSRRGLHKAVRRVGVRDGSLLIAGLALVVTGLVQWSGVPAAKPWHSTATVAFLITAGVHLWGNRRRLAHRIRETGRLFRPGR